MRQRYIFFLLIIISLVACEESELGTVPDAKVVVEAYLHAEQPIGIHISKEVLFKREESDSTFDIEGLEVVLNDGNESFQLTDEGNGIYSSVSLVDNTKNYSMSFHYNGIEISAESTVPDKPEDYTSSKTSIKIEPFTGGGPPSFSSESVELNWTNEDGSYYIVVVTNLEEDPPPINEIFQRPSFRSEPLVTDNYEIQSQEFRYYGMHSMMLYKVNPDYAALYEDPGDNSLTIKTPYTNIANGLGIFTAINSDTLYVDVY